jgi:hypothetical protein
MNEKNSQLIQQKEASNLKKMKLKCSCEGGGSGGRINRHHL